LFPELRKERRGLCGQLLARGAAHVTRLSCIFALLERARAVDVQHLTAAFAWWDYVVESVDLIFAGRTGHDTADRIRTEMLPGQRLSMTDIREQLFGGHLSAGRLKDALDLLRELGEVHTEEETTGGRPRVMVV